MNLVEQLAEFSSDPYGFVLFAFPWGEVGELETFSGPQDWQIRVLEDLGTALLTLEEAVQIARTSGHGIGKSALVAWIILWAISTFEDTKGVVTANTENQLKTKTWAEVAKWHRLFIAREYFKMTATALFADDPLHERTWRIDMVPWSERNTEAFAGLHNQGKRILVIFDEGSAIPDVIYEVTEGALTDRNTQIIWMVFGNPTRNTGRFRECFAGGRFAHRWSSQAIDSRDVPISNKDQLNRWIADYGEDSYFGRVRVRGMFPRVDAESFIAFDIATGAVERDLYPQSGAVVLGVDVGRFGDDPSVIYPRCGRDGLSRQIEILSGIDTMTLAGRVASAFLRHGATICMVDEGGVGGGVVDRLRQLRIPVIGVDFGSKADGFSSEGTKYANKRAEIWGATRDWLAQGGAIPNILTGENATLVDELIGPTYTMTKREEIQLESKKEMRARGVPSPNVADALACTFAFPSFEYQITSPSGVRIAEKMHVEADYDPFAREAIYGDT